MSLASDPLVPRQLVPADLPPVPPSGPLMSARNRDKAHAMGLASATGLVVGSIVGTGVFTMPAVLAGAGTMGIVVLAVIARRRDAPRGVVRPAQQAGTSQ